MKQKICFILLIALLGLFQNMALAQTTVYNNVIGCAGGEASNTNIGVCFNIGEPVIETVTIPSGFITQGFEQPEWCAFTSIEESGNFPGNISVFPNPSSEFINVHLQSESGINILAELIDMTGKILFTKTLSGKTIAEKVDVSIYSEAIYMFRITDTKEQFTKTWKIQKLN